MTKRKRPFQKPRSNRLSLFRLQGAGRRVAGETDQRVRTRLSTGGNGLRPACHARRDQAAADRQHRGLRRPAAASRVSRELFSVRPIMVWQEGYLWQPFTYMWLHGSLGHIAMNLFSLWMFGSPLALAWGANRFLRFYLVCGIGAGFVIASWPYLAVCARREQRPARCGRSRSAPPGRSTACCSPTR